MVFFFVSHTKHIGQQINESLRGAVDMANSRTAKALDWTNVALRLRAVPGRINHEKRAVCLFMPEAGVAMVTAGHFYLQHLLSVYCCMVFSCIQISGATPMKDGVP
jgi:hypothetical protein